MKIDFLNKFLTSRYIDTGISQIIYNFKNANISGFFVKNLVHSGIDQYGQENNNKYLLQDYHPGFFSSCNQKNYKLSGYGIFEGNDRLEVSKSLNSDELNIILNIKSYGCDPDYIDINEQNLNEPSGIIWNNSFFQRTGYASGIQFVGQNNKKITFNKTGISTNFSDWSYISGNFTGIIETGIQSKLKKSINDKNAYSLDNFLLGKDKTLINLKSIEGIQRPFDVRVGLNQAYKLTLQFSGNYSGEDYLFNKTLSCELADQNIISFNIYKNNLSVCYHDFLTYENYCENIILNNDFFNQNYNIYLGNKYSGDNDNLYVGYRGLLEDVIIFNKYLNPETILDLSKIIIKTGEDYINENIYQKSYKLLSSGFLTTGILGSGITGYELIATQQIQSCNDDCVFYIKSGITGFLTGELIEYRLVQPENFSIEKSGIYRDLYNQDLAKNFSKKYLILYKNIDNKDFFEVRSYGLFDDLKKTTANGDSYLTESDIENKNILVYFNGVNVSPEYYSIKNIKNFIIDKPTKDLKDNVLYKEITTGLKQYVIDYTGEDKVGPITGDYDMYLNGQKLLSGFNYERDKTCEFSAQNIVSNINGIPTVILPQGCTVDSWQSDTLANLTCCYNNYYYNILKNNTLATGELYIVEKGEIINYISGKNINIININDNYNSNYVWLNGILQKEFDDYIFTSCNNPSLGWVDVSVKTINIFDINTDNRFNID